MFTLPVRRALRCAVVLSVAVHHLSHSRHQGTGMKDWQCTLLNPGAALEDRVSAFKRLGSHSAWRKALRRHDTRLRRHLVLGASPEAIPAPLATPTRQTRIDIGSLQELKEGAVSAVDAFVPVATAAATAGTEQEVDKAVAMLEAAQDLELTCRKLAEAASQQRAAAHALLHAAKERTRAGPQLRRVLEASRTSVDDAVAKVRAAVASDRDSDINRAVQGRGKALGAAQVSLRDAMDKLKNTVAHNRLSDTETGTWRRAETQLSKFEQMSQAQGALFTLLKVRMWHWAPHVSVASRLTLDHPFEPPHGPIHLCLHRRCVLLSSLGTKRKATSSKL